MTLDSVLTGNDPIILMLTHGETLQTEVTKALNEAEKQGLKVVRVNVNEHPEYAEQFKVGKHPVMIAWHCGEEVSRRPRPWGTDATEIVKTVKELKATAAPAPSPMEKDALAATPGKTPEKTAIAADKPVAVTDATFEELVFKSELPVLVDFWADWCGPCKAVAPILDKLAKEFAGQVRIAKLDVDHNPVMSGTFQIRSIPTLMFVKGGKIVGMNAGAAPEPALRDAIKQLIALKI